MAAATAIAASLNAGGIISASSNNNSNNSTSVSSAQDFKTLEQTRQRLLQLTATLAALKREIEINDPLPTWPNIQTSFALLTHHLSALAALLSPPASISTAERHPDAHHDNGNQDNEDDEEEEDEEDEATRVLRTGHAHPLPSFPREHEGLLGQLLRKKLEIGVENWVAQGRSAAGGAGAGTGTTTTTTAMTQEHVRAKEELWNWAAAKVRELGRSVPWNTDYTLEEHERGIESVRTGVRRKLTLGDEEDDDDDEDKDEDSSTAPANEVKKVKMLSLEDVYRYESMGILPLSASRR